MYFGGTDSTAYTALMMVYYSVSRPEVVERLREEAVHLEGKDISVEGLKKVTYLDAMFYETMRLYTPFNAILFR